MVSQCCRKAGWAASGEQQVYGEGDNEQEMRQQNDKVGKRRCGKNDAKRRCAA